jgi:26S proteasome regulatory subunit N12
MLTPLPPGPNHHHPLRNRLVLRARLPISNAKNLLFLDSEGAVVQFAQSRGWVAKDGRIYFPEQEAEAHAAERDVMSASGTVIENTLGYARKLETIV